MCYSSEVFSESYFPPQKHLWNGNEVIFIEENNLEILMQGEWISHVDIYYLLVNFFIRKNYYCLVKLVLN